MNIDYLDKMYYLIHKFFPQVDSVSTIMMEFEWQAIDNLKKTHLSYTEVMKKNEDIFLKWGQAFGERFRLYHFPLCVVKIKNFGRTCGELSLHMKLLLRNHVWIANHGNIVWAYTKHIQNSMEIVNLVNFLISQTMLWKIAETFVFIQYNHSYRYE